MNELILQRLLIASTKRMGGYARKWATQLAVGVPDLIVVRNDHVLFLEVKYIRKVPVGFKRTINVTSKQAIELNAIATSCKKHVRALVVVVADLPDGRIVVAMDPPNARESLVLSHDMILNNRVKCLPWTENHLLISDLTGGI